MIHKDVSWIQIIIWPKEQLYIKSDLFILVDLY